MASKGYTIKIAGDVAGFMKETRKAEDALDTIADALDELADDSRTSANAAGKSMDTISDAARAAGKDVNKELDKAFDKAADSADDAADKSAKAYKEMSEKIQRDLDAIRERQRKTSSESKDAFREVGDEMRQNWGETMSSFDGSAQSAVDMIADTFGGLAASLGIGGPLGTIFLGSLAGLIANYGTKWVEGFEKTKEANAAMYDQMLENATGYFNDSQIVENFNKIMSGADDAMIDTKTLENYVRQTGIAAQDIALAFADIHSEQAHTLAAIMEDKQNKLNEALSRVNVSGNEYAAVSASIAKTMGQDLVKTWNDHSDAITTNTDKIKSNTDYLAQYGYGIEQTGEKVRALTEAHAASNDAISDATDAITANNSAYQSAALAYDANTAALSDLSGAFIDEQNAAKEANKTSQEVSALQYDQAAAFIAAAQQAGISSKKALELAQSYGLIPDSVATDIATLGVEQAKTKAAEAEKAVKNVPEKHEIKITATYDEKQTSSVWTAIKNYFATPVNVPVNAVRSRTEY